MDDTRIEHDTAGAGRRPGRGEPFSPALRRSVGVVMIGASLSFLDATIVNVAVDTLATDLKTGLTTVQWVVTAYPLSLAAVIPVTGWLARRVGAARLYVVALAVFTVGSALCACSQGVDMLIGARVLQGLGGGALMPVGTMIWTAQSSRAQMGRVMGLISIPVVLMPTLGPVVGGLLIRSVGWQAIFWVNIPVGIAGIALALRLLPRGARSDAGRLDVTGLILSAVAVVGLTYSLTELGASREPATAAVVALPVALVALAGFVVHALRAHRPLLDLRLYGNRAFSAASVSTFALGAANYGGMILMPLYLQEARGEDVVVAGLLLAPTGMGALLALPLTDRYGAGITAAAGTAVLAAATVPLVFLTATTPYLVLCLVMLARGVGFGLSIVPVMTAAYRVLPPAAIPDATPQLNVLQRIGGAVGTAVLAVVLADQLRHAPTATERAHAFGTAFLVVLVITAIAALPTVVLARAGASLTGRTPRETHRRQ